MDICILRIRSSGDSSAFLLRLFALPAGLGEADISTCSGPPVVVVAGGARSKLPEEAKCDALLPSAAIASALTTAP